MIYSVYTLGRSPGRLEPPYQDQDKTFGGIRLDGKSVRGARFEHCTFANISFKQAHLALSNFFDCVFIGCYFRRADISETKFLGCRFIDCDFPHLAIRGCDFRYTKFSNCYIPFGEIEHSLPQEPNLREQLTRNLALETSKLGLPQEARVFKMCEIRAGEEDLLAAFRGQSKWYRDHYDIFRRIKAVLNLGLSLANRWLWGYGEKIIVLVRNFMLAGFIVFPLAFYFLRNQLVCKPKKEISLFDTLHFSLENIFPAGIQSDVIAVHWVARFLAGLESLTGLVMAGLFVAYVFRWSLHR